NPSSCRAERRSPTLRPAGSPRTGVRFRRTRRRGFGTRPCSRSGPPTQILRNRSCCCSFWFELGLIGRESGELVGERLLERRTRFSALHVRIQIRKAGDQVGVPEEA